MQLHYKKEPAVPKTKVKKHPVKSEFKRSVWACVRSEPEEKTAVLIKQGLKLRFQYSASLLC